MQIAKRALVLDDVCKSALLDRRSIVRGLLVSLTSLAAGHRALAQPSDIPYFRSGNFQFTILRPVQQLPSVRLFPLSGKVIDLSTLRGRPVLLNFWASWCAACRTELPILELLQEETSAAGLQIIAVSEDRAPREVVQQFLDKLKIRKLKVYWDPNGHVAFSDPENERNAPFGLYGMPITYAIAASGWIVGYMPGAADWRSPDGRRLIEFLHKA